MELLGTLWNPRLCEIDIKMLLYNVGAVGLLINVLSFASVNYYRNGERLSLGMLVYVLKFFWFLVDYTTFERVHLYTYGTK